jgi:phosphatidylcholine synthase
MSSRPSRVLAWAAHAFTASGVVLGFLALEAAEAGRVREAMIWLAIAMVVDAVDGSFARAARVKEALPHVEGANLDLVIDYLTWVLVPTLLMYKTGAFPPALALPTTLAILVSALYHSARLDMKTPDYYFHGFPAWWSMVAGYVVVLRPNPWVTLVIVVACCVLTFTKVHFIHPLRVKDFRTLTLVVLAVWGVATVLLLVQYPHPSPALAAVSIAGAAYLLGVGFLRTIRGPTIPASSAAAAEH